MFPKCIPHTLDQNKVGETLSTLPTNIVIPFTKRKCLYKYTTIYIITRYEDSAL